MTIAAIIAEYNPFHNGHLYHLNETRKQLDADYIILLMSGNYVQRGAPALYNKYLRTQMALCCGADAVFELPVGFALSSAERFAGGAVRLLDQLGAVQFLSFGSECGSIEPLWDYAQLLQHSYRHLEFLTLLRENQKKGMSFPSARDHAIREYFSDKSNLSLLPNNILGIEYCKAILIQNSTIQPFTIKRQGEDYHSQLLPHDHQSYVSATALRQSIKENGHAPADNFPVPVYELICKYDLFHHFLCENDFSLPLYYKLLCEQSDGFSSYLDCSKELSDKICRHLPEFLNFEQFCFLLKTKELTYTRISRVLMHILLNIRSDERSEDLTSLPHAPYIRLLGFREKSAEVLKIIKKSSEIPIISKPADAVKLLSKNDYPLFLQDIQCSHIYEAVYAHTTKRTALNEYRQSPILFS